MSIHSSRQALAFKLPEMLSYHSTWDDADYEPVQPHKRTLFERLSGLSRGLAVLSQRRAVRNELYSLTDRELADIGLNRYDVERVFDPEFAHDHAGRGA